MRITKKALSLVLAVMMVITMMSVMAVSVNAAVVDAGNESAVCYLDPYPHDGTGRIYYDDLQEAVNNTSSNYYLRLLKDVVLTETITNPQDKAVYFFFDGHTVSGNIDVLFNINGGSMYMHGPGSIEVSGNYGIKVKDCLFEMNENITVSGSPRNALLFFDTFVNTWGFEINNCNFYASTGYAFRNKSTVGYNRVESCNFSAPYYAVINEGNVTISGFNGGLNQTTFTITSTKAADAQINNYPAVYNSGSLYLHKMTINSASSGVNSVSGVVTISNSDIQAHDFGVTTFGETTVNVQYNTSIHTVDDACLSGNGTAQYAGYAFNVGVYENDTVSLTSDNAAAIYHPNNGTLNIKGGTIKGKTAVYIKSGTATIGTADTSISGATLIGTGEAKDYEYKSSGYTCTGEALVVENCGYPGGTPSIRINGGTFTTEHAANSVNSYSSDENTHPVVEDFVYGGVYNKPLLEKVVAKGFENTVYNEQSGTYTVKIKDNALKDVAVIEGYQSKISEAGVRIYTKVDRDFLEQYASEYGYYVGKYSGAKTQNELSFDRFNKNNGAKVINCKGSENTIEGFGKDYVTLSVNGMEDGSKVVARFYAVINGKLCFADYVDQDNNSYDGILAKYSVTSNA